MEKMHLKLNTLNLKLMATHATAIFINCYCKNNFAKFSAFNGGRI
jgi:hypothetical protein